MLTFKCKICGGSLNVEKGQSVCECPYCGTNQTLPLIDSDKKIRLFNRANEYRLQNEFDKAYSAYEAIINEEPGEAEAYWGLVLSEYGIEYIEDSKTNKRIPTCHRTKTQSILNSLNYKETIKNADAERRMMYQDEAEVIDKLQKQILSISSKEEPYDVFICYKETDENGERTEDSVIAQDIYNALDKEGIRTFLSRVSLSSHVGENYEPYIFAALSSAKVMLMVTTKSEYCESVWVKNEWGRFVKLKEEDPSRSIIPVYKGISPYELPAELQFYQGQDIGKVGSLQDLIAGIKKLLGTTNGQIKNKEIETLLTKERKKTKKKENRRKVLLTIGKVLAVLLIATGVFFGASRLIYREKMTTMPADGSIPDPSEYNMFQVTINTADFDNYFSLVSTNGFSALQSKLYEEGWYIFEMEEGKRIWFYTSGSTEISDFKLPLLIQTRTSNIKSVAFHSTTVTYVHKDFVRSYQMKEDGKRLLLLKNGKVIVDDFWEWLIKSNTYYAKYQMNQFPY